MRPTYVNVVVATIMAVATTTLVLTARAPQFGHGAARLVTPFSYVAATVLGTTLGASLGVISATSTWRAPRWKAVLPVILLLWFSVSPSLTWAVPRVLLALVVSGVLGEGVALLGTWHFDLSAPRGAALGWCTAFAWAIFAPPFPTLHGVGHGRLTTGTGPALATIFAFYPRPLALTAVLGMVALVVGGGAACLYLAGKIADDGRTRVALAPLVVGALGSLGLAASNPLQDILGSWLSAAPGLLTGVAGGLVGLLLAQVIAPDERGLPCAYQWVPVALGSVWFLAGSPLPLWGRDGIFLLSQGRWLLGTLPCLLASAVARLSFGMRRGSALTLAIAVGLASALALVATGP